MLRCVWNSDLGCSPCGPGVDGVSASRQVLRQGRRRCGLTTSSAAQVATNTQPATLSIHYSKLCFQNTNMKRDLDLKNWKGSQPLFGLFLNPVPLFMNSRQLNTIALSFSTCFQVLEKSIFLENVEDMICSSSFLKEHVFCFISQKLHSVGVTLLSTKNEIKKENQDKLWFIYCLEVKWTKQEIHIHKNEYFWKAKLLVQL